MTANKQALAEKQAALAALCQQIFALEERLDCLFLAGKPDIKLSRQLKSMCGRRNALRHYINAVKRNSI